MLSLDIMESAIGSKFKEIIIDQQDVMEYIGDDPVNPFVRDASDFRTSFNEYRKTKHLNPGAALPWGKTHDAIRFRPGELTLWTGISGHGKSQMLGMASMGFMAHGEKVLIMSFEMQINRTLERMLAQAARNDSAPEQFEDKFMDYLVERCYFFDHFGSVEPKHVFAAIKYAAARNVKHVVVDSLMKCVKGADNYNGEKDFVDTLHTIAQKYNIHIHLVSHIKKLENEETMPGKFDVKGSSALTDCVDQVLIVHRNKLKERLLRANRNDAKAMSMADTTLAIAKSRHDGEEIHFKFWFHRSSQQFTGDSRNLPFDLTNGAL